jgi:aryl-alcohol dehydrogenase-like predicted oxidoreductase
MIEIPGLGALPPLGVGTWQWGDRLFWRYGQGYQESDLRQVYQESLKAGIRLFDTAEIYGQGQSERLLGRFLMEGEVRPRVVSKFFPWPWRLSRASLLAALRGSLNRLNVQQLDLYLLHWPAPPVPLTTWAEALAEAFERGLTRAVGVSNCNLAQLERVARVLSRHRVPLSVNQVEYNLLVRDPEHNGLRSAMRAEGIVLMAYSPLAMGWLSGKYTPENPPPLLRTRKYRKLLPRIPQLLAGLNQVAEAHQATPAQVALAWCIAQGTLPIPGAKIAAQAQSNARALGLQLTPQEVERLSALSA